MKMGSEAMGFIILESKLFIKQPGNYEFNVGHFRNHVSNHRAGYAKCGNEPAQWAEHINGFFGKMLPAHYYPGYESTIVFGNENLKEK